MRNIREFDHTINTRNARHFNRL